MKLALGIGSFGQLLLNSTKYLNTITEYNTLVVIDEFIPNKYTIPTFLTDKRGHVIQSFDTLFHTLDFELIMSIYTQCVVFVGIGGSYSSSVLEKILTQCSPKVLKKLFIIAVQPFNFEGKNKQIYAKKWNSFWHSWRLIINYFLINTFLIIPNPMILRHRWICFSKRFTMLSHTERRVNEPFKFSYQRSVSGSSL